MIVSWSLFSWSLEELTWEHYWKSDHDYFLSRCHFFACQFQQVCLNFDIEAFPNPFFWYYMEQRRKDDFFSLWKSIFFGSQRKKFSFWTIYTIHTYKRTCSDLRELCSREQRTYLSLASILIRRRPTRWEGAISKVIQAILVTSGQEQFRLCSQVCEICELWGGVQRLLIQPGHKHLRAGQHHQPRRSSTRWVTTVL